MRQTTAFLLTVTVVVLLIAGGVIMKESNPRWTSHELEWKFEVEFDSEGTSVSFHGPPFGSEIESRVSMILPIACPDSWGIEKGSIGLTGGRSGVSRGSENVSYDWENRGWAESDFTYSDFPADYRLTFLDGGRAVQVGGDTVPLAPGDRMDIVFTSPTEYEIAVNDIVVVSASGVFENDAD